MVLFLGTEAALDTTGWSEEAPAFYVGEPEEREASVRKHFNTSRVYYLGSHTGCGCGYEFGQDPAWYDWAASDPEAADADPDGPTSRQSLAALLRSLLDAGHPVELYALWSGDEDTPPDHRSRIRPEAVLDPATVLEGHHLVVTDTS